MNRTIATLATVAALGFGTAAVAQTMTEGYDMLQTALSNEFVTLGLPTEDLEGLTLGQVAAIKAVIESEESDGNKKSSVEAIIAQE